MASDPGLMHEVYRDVERLRLKLWSGILVNEEEVDWAAARAFGLPTSRAEIKDGVICVVLNDYLPRVKTVKGEEVRLHWIRMVVDAINRLGSVPVFERAFCVIVPYLPAGGWDADNVAYKYILDGVRYAVLDGDTYDKLSFAVIGAVDKERPRTEVYIVEAPEGMYQDLPKKLKTFIGQGAGAISAI